MRANKNIIILINFCMKEDEAFQDRAIVNYKIARTLHSI